MALVAGGGGNELLDYVQTQAYWQMQDTPVTAAAMIEELQTPKAENVGALIADLSAPQAARREAASAKLRAMGEAALPELQKVTPGATLGEKDLRIAQLIEQIGRRRGGLAIRRLMAIRTLGELKDASAAPVLRGLATSKAPFEADYAQAALAAIEGKAYVRPGTPGKAFAGDPWLLPEGCGVVGQVKLPPGGAVDYAKAMAGMPDLPPEAPQQVTKIIVDAAERIGNVRADGATIGVSADIGQRDKDGELGWVAVILRGRYNVEAVRGFLAAEIHAEAGNELVDDVPVMRAGREFALAFVSDTQLVIVGGPSRVDKTPVIKALIAAGKTGKGGLTGDSPLGKLIATVDTTRPTWAAMIVNDNFRKIPWLEPFDTVTFVLDSAKQADNMTILARGPDAQKVAETVAKAQADVAEAKARFARMAQDEPVAAFVGPTADLVNSVQVKADGTGATLTATVKGAGTSMGVPLMWGRYSSRAPAGAARVKAARTRPAPASQPVEP
ncbi:MAG: hypothetical protein NTV86_12240 [Planctomycetota bacterium]|nr:hypothetical protein [Planctomycetota bacterium]